MSNIERARVRAVDPAPRVGRSGRALSNVEHTTVVRTANGQSEGFVEQMIDMPHRFGPVPEGCDVPGWIPFMTTTELGWDHEKLTIDWATGEEYLSSPSTEARTDVR